MGSITLVNSQAIGLAPWANSVLLHCPNHLPSSLATSLPKRRRSQFSNHRPAVTVFSGVGVTNSVPVVSPLFYYYFPLCGIKIEKGFGGNSFYFYFYFFIVIFGRFTMFA
jgi:hypothetical protein